MGNLVLNVPIIQSCAGSVALHMHGILLVGLFHGGVLMCMAAVLEYLAANILQHVRNGHHKNDRICASSCHVPLAIPNDV